MINRIFILLISAIFTICLFSCIPSKTQEKAEITHLEALLIKCFDKCPNWNNNDITMECLSDTIKKDINQYIGKKACFINDLPMKFVGCTNYDYKIPGKYIVLFKFSGYFRKPKKNVITKYPCSLQVASILDKSEAAKLVEEEKYYINGKMLDAEKDKLYIDAGRYFVDNPHVYKGALVTEDCSVDMGTIVLDSLTFKLCKINNNEENHKSPGN